MPDNKPYLFPDRQHHPDDAQAERQRLADRTCAAINDLANLDGRFAELAGIVLSEIRALYPEPIADAGPDKPPPPPPPGG